MRIKRLAFIIILSIIFCHSACIIAQKVEIQYLANEGILIKGTNTQLLIDATFKKEFDYLDVLPDSELEKIENAVSPYDNINLILATHVHGDHFNAELTGEHLELNQEALFLGPDETVANFKENFDGFERIATRVNSETPDFFESKTIVLKDIEIEVLRLEHLGDSPWKEAENVAYLINIEGKKIIHFGDAKIDVDNLEKCDLISKNIDVAILPFWQLGPLSQKAIIEKYINPKLILAGHIPPKSQSGAQEKLDSLEYENVIALTEQLKIITIK